MGLGPPNVPVGVEIAFFFFGGSILYILLRDYSGCSDYSGELGEERVSRG
jgi:hypothetical protein